MRKLLKEFLQQEIGAWLLENQQAPQEHDLAHCLLSREELALGAPGPALSIRTPPPAPFPLPAWLCSHLQPTVPEGHICKMRGLESRKSTEH